MSNTIKERPRARQYHHKTRSGCSTCKKRKVKCDESRPLCARCVSAGFGCGGYDSIPKARIFTPSSFAAKSKSSTIKPTSDHESSSSDTEAATSLLSITQSPSSPFHADSERYAHDFFVHWMQNFSSPRAGTTQTVWTDLIPQLAYRYDPIRDALIACGHIGMSHARRDSADAYSKAMVQGTEFANRAIGGLLNTKASPTVLLVASWLFSQLDMVRGYLTGSAAHLSSGAKIATQLPPSSDTEQEVMRQLVLEAFNSNNYIFELEKNFPDILKQKTAQARRKKAIILLQHSLGQVSLARKRLEDSDLIVRDRMPISTLLTYASNELRWILRKWSPSSIPDDDSLVDSTTWLQASTPNIFTPYLENIGTEEHTLWKLELEFNRTLSIFLLRVAQDDRVIRQDLAEFLEYVMKERQAAASNTAAT